MNVLLVTHGVKDLNTAVYRNTCRRAEFLRERGNEAHVLAPADVRVGHGRLMPILYPLAVAWWIVRRPPFDTIAFQSHTGWVYQLLRSLLPRHRRTRVAVTFHGLDVLYVRALAEDLARRGQRQTLRFRMLHEHLLPGLSAWSCRRSDLVFCMNSAEQRFLLEQGWTTLERIRRMPNCVEDSDFVAAVRPPDGALHLLTLAQWTPQKGFRYLIEAFTALVRSGRDVELTCAGTWQPPARVLGGFPDDVRARVRVIPSIMHAEVPRIYAGAHVFVLASVFEGFSIALLEAMAAGLPIVATAAGAAADILTHGEDALLVPCGDAAALKSAIATLAADPALRDSLGARARARARAFTCDRVLSAFAADLLETESAAESMAV